MSAAFTPTPWRVETIDAYGYSPRIFSSGENFKLIAECGNGELDHQDEWEANADFIVQAVNAHDALVEALQWYMEQAEGCRKLGILGDPARHALNADRGAKARAALALAQGIQPS